MPTNKKAPAAPKKTASTVAKPEPQKPVAKQSEPKKAVAAKQPANAPAKDAVKKPVASATPSPKKDAPAPAVATSKSAKNSAKPAEKAAQKSPTQPAAKSPAQPAAKVPAKPEAKSASKPESVGVKPPSPAAAKPAAAVKPAAGAKPAASVKPAAAAKPPVKDESIKPTPAPVKSTTTMNNAARMAEMRKAARAQEAAKPAKAVAMPKISATSSRKYEPEFTKSVLDKPMQEQTGPTMRYSDSDLQEFRELIARKLDAAKKELTYLHGLITRKDAMTGDETDSRYMTMEDGSLSMEREQLSQMASRQHDFIDKLEKALIRIENKTYGICRVSGKLIDKARLRAVPHATLSMESKMGMSKNPNLQ
jgi:RNA polymerase-binding transcription factor DksA